MTRVPFKKCNVCQKEWANAGDFLDDPAIELVGYQVDFEELESGHFLFNHNHANTLAVAIEAFKHLKSGPIFTEKRTGKDDCPGYCLYQSALESCSAQCECRWVRDVMQTIRNWKKTQ